MSFSIDVMQPADYDEVYALWKQSEGVGLTPSDNREAVTAFLARNPGLSLVVRQKGTLVGAVLAGHDGRRGFLYHLAVAVEFRRQGMARALVDECLARFAAAGVQKSTIFVYRHNQTGHGFWRTIGWNERADLVVLQRETATAK